MEDEDDTPQSSPTLALAIPTEKPKAVGPSAGGGGGREDCWSEGATAALIDAWGERFLELSRGNLKRKHWQEVADVVSSRDDYTRAPKSDAQCKNRIDTLKKKYKLEKSKIMALSSSSSPPYSSPWPFFSRLNDVIARSPHKMSVALPPSSTFHVQQPCKKKRSKKKSHRKLLQKLPPVPRRESSPSSGSSPPANGKRRRRRNKGVEVSSGKGLREMTRAIVKFGEMYERVERSKLQQAAEMEKQRMVFAKELELQRMHFFMKTQLELTQLKRHGRSKEEEEDGAGVGAAAGGGAGNYCTNNSDAGNSHSNNSNNNGDRV